DGMNPKLEFIEQMVLQQCVSKKTMAVNHQIPAILFFEFGCLRCDIAVDNGRIAPIRLPQGGRKDILTDVVDSVPIRPCSMRESCGEELVCPPSHQHRIALQKQF